MRKENFILLTEIPEGNSKTLEPNIIINTNSISSIYENAENNCVIVMNHLDFENQQNFTNNYPKRIVVKENFKKIQEILGI